jgi:hypothetical protein
MILPIPDVEHQEPRHSGWKQFCAGCRVLKAHVDLVTMETDWLPQEVRCGRITANMHRQIRGLFRARVRPYMIAKRFGISEASVNRLTHDLPHDWLKDRGSVQSSASVDLSSFHHQIEVRV